MDIQISVVPTLFSGGLAMRYGWRRVNSIRKEIERVKRLALVAAVVFLTASLAAADQLIVNGGFETGDFTGWAVNVEAGSGGNLFVSSATTSPDSGFQNAGPASGTYFALSDQLGPGAYALTQSFTVAPDQNVVLSFDLFANEYAGGAITGPLDYELGYIEFATVDLLAGGANPFSTTTGVLQNFYAGAGSEDNVPNPWTSYSFNISSLVAAGGTFQIRFGEADRDGTFNMGVDNVSVMDDGSAVPEPATMLLTCSALAGLFLLRRKAQS
jgi:hypothetical protein